MTWDFWSPVDLWLSEYSCIRVALQDNFHDMKIERHFSDSAWEEKVQFCRALRAGNQIYVAGTAAVNSEGIVKPYDPAAQTWYILEKIEVDAVIAE